jgi:hypothetical protein
MRHIFQLVLAMVLATQSIWVAASDVCHHAPGAQASQSYAHHADHSSHHSVQGVEISVVASADAQADTKLDCGVCHLAHLSMNLVELAPFEVLAIKGEVPKSVSAGALLAFLYSIDRPNWLS